MNIKRVISKVRDANVRDFLSVFPMLAGLFASPFYKKKYKNTWGICERKTEARDNGYHFFKFMTSEHPEQKCIYAIDKKCSDYRKVYRLGETVQFGSVKHWILYFTCKYLISSQAFKPDGYVCTFIERAGLFHPNHVFLQHGITINKPEYLQADMRQAKFFITATPQETKFVAEELGYKNEAVKMCGFSRFDALHDKKPVGKRIFIMPTWRKWLRFQSETHEDARKDILSSEYFLMWRAFLCDKKLKELVEQNDLDIVFYPHPNMIGIIDPNSFVPPYIKVVDIGKGDIQELMKSSQMLVTDYSSVFFDMVYMKRPVIFYQFDIEKFRKYHYAKGWFDYGDTSFGKSFSDSENLIAEIGRIVESDFQTDQNFIDEHKRTFPQFDSMNSRRIFEMLKNEV